MNIQQQLLHTESSAVKGHSIDIQNEGSSFLHGTSAAGEGAGPKPSKRGQNFSLSGCSGCNHGDGPLTPVTDSRVVAMMSLLVSGCG